jgi:hypothetical protein
MSYGGFRVPNDSGGMAFQVKPDGSIKIGDTSDDIAQVTGTLSVNGPAVFNEGSLDADFRVESNHNTHMLYIDGGSNRIGIGTSGPQVTIDVQERPGIDAVLRMMGTADVGIRLAADSDNSGENDNPYIDWYQDGQNSNSRNNRLASMAMEGDAGGTFTDSIANAIFIDAYCPNAANSNLRPIQFANDSSNNGHKARITIEGTNGYVGIHTATPSTELQIIGTTKSDYYATEVGTQDLGTGTSSTLSIDAGIMLLDADSISGVDMGGFEVHTLSIPNGSTSGQRLTLIAQSTTNSTTIMPAGSINGSYGSLSDTNGTTALEFVWISTGAISAWYQVS